MREILFSLLILTLHGCSTPKINSDIKSSEGASSDSAQSCVGSTELPDSIASSFESVEDPDLLQKALGGPNQGQLCQGQTYVSKVNTNITIFRAWNSTNPNSQFGNWWAFTKPTGSISAYHSNYEICYQWSPIDKLVSCTLEPNTKIVVGNGQSAFCSDYLTYPVSATQQIYIENSSETLTNCTVFDGEFNWKPSSS